MGTSKKACFSFKYLKNAISSVASILPPPFSIHAIYFVAISLVGFIPLRLSPTKTKRHMNLLDAFYTSVSSATVTSLGVVPMEDLSFLHLVVIIVLMLLGGQAFTSFSSLLFARRRIPLLDNSFSTDHCLNAQDQIPREPTEDSKHIIGVELEQWEISERRNMGPSKNQSNGEKVVDGNLEYLALTYLGFLGIAYFLFVHLAAITLVYIYFCVSKDGERTLSERGVSKCMFAVFTVVSSFANCGFTPLNDNMMPFRKHSVLLLILAFPMVIGNTMLGPCFKAFLHTLSRFSRVNGRRRNAYDYIVKNGHIMFPDHLFSTRENMWVFACEAGFIAMEMVMLFGLHWDSVALKGLTAGEKVIGGFFQSVAVRHAGENIVNPQLLSPALLLIYIVLMYLPPYPIYKVGGGVTNTKSLSMKESSVNEENWSNIMQLKNVLLNDSSYLFIAVILICITERYNLSQDPLNFNVLAIVFEVVSAYGNVGISLGYNCALFNRISRHYCKEVPYSFSGKWSPQGKLVIIIVMFLGRLKGKKIFEKKATHS